MSHTRHPAKVMQELFLDLEEGDQVTGLGQTWTVSRLLGMGRCAKVYHVTSNEGSISTAVKVFRKEEKYRLVFIKEIRNLDAVYGNRHIASIYGSFSYRGHPFLVFELLDCNVKQLIVKNNQECLSLYLTQQLLRDILECLHHVHTRGWVHADLKPANVMWSPQEGCWKVIDFGHSFQEGHQDYSQIQSFCYQAPEAKTWNAFICRHGNFSRGKLTSTPPKACTSAVDIWSLACIIAGVFTGNKLYSQDDVTAGGCSQCKKSCDTVKCECEPVIDSIIKPRVVDNKIPKYREVLADLRDLLKQMLQCNLSKRPTADESLSHHFFTHKLSPSFKDLVLLPTRILRLLDVTTDINLKDEEEYKDVFRDIQGECEKYGPTRSMLLPKEGLGQGKAYIEYEDAADCENAQRALVGREFDGKPVLATFFPLRDFRSRDLH